jgi:hypothetical protein
MSFRAGAIMIACDQAQGAGNRPAFAFCSRHPLYPKTVLTPSGHLWRHGRGSDHRH